MALRKINTMVDALSIGPGKDEVKKVSGYLLGAKFGIGATKKKKGSTKFTACNDKGEHMEFWGNASISSALCLDGEDKLNPALNHVWVEVHFVKMGKKVPGKNQQKICDVFTDDERVFKTPPSRGEVDYKPKK